MSDGDQLLQTILEYPEDDAPRLIYADWLDEHATTIRCNRHGGDGKPLSDQCSHCNGTGRVSNGYAVQAEFIRAQIKLMQEQCRVTHDLVWPDHDCNCEFCKEVVRLVPLWQKQPHYDLKVGTNSFHLHLGSGTYISHNRAFELWWTRGFLDKVICNTEDWLGHGHNLVKVCPIARVELRDREPLQVEGGFYWLDRHKQSLQLRRGRTPRNELPLRLYDSLFPDTIPISATAGYATHEAAQAALSQAALHYAWRRPHLLPIDQPTTMGHAPRT